MPKCPQSCADCHKPASLVNGAWTVHIGDSQWGLESLGEEQKDFNTRCETLPGTAHMHMKSSDSLSGSLGTGRGRVYGYGSLGIRLLRAPDVTLRGEDTSLQEMNPWEVSQEK